MRLNVEQLEPRENPGHWLASPDLIDNVAYVEWAFDHEDYALPAPTQIGGGPIRVSVIGADATFVQELWASLGPYQNFLVVGEGMDWSRAPWTQVALFIVPSLDWTSTPSWGEASFVLNPAVATVDDQPAAYAVKNVRAAAHELGHTMGLGHSPVPSDFMYPVALPTPAAWSDQEILVARSVLAGFVTRFAL